MRVILNCTIITICSRTGKTQLKIVPWAATHRSNSNSILITPTPLLLPHWWTRLAITMAALAASLCRSWRRRSLCRGIGALARRIWWVARMAIWTSPRTISIMRTAKTMQVWRPVARERTRVERPLYQCCREAIANSRARLAITTLLVRKPKDRPVHATCERTRTHLFWQFHPPKCWKICHY